MVYNKAIKDVHLKSTQVSDRFHILKNLINYYKQYIKRIFKNKIAIGKLEDINSGETLHLKEKYKLETKWDLILMVKELRDRKYKVDDISSILGMRNKTVITYSKISAEEILLDGRTVRKYLESDGNWNHASRREKKKSKLDNYKDLVKIKTQGYTGSESLIRKFITDFRSETIERNEAVDIRYVKRNDLINLLYKPIEKVGNVTLEEFEVVLDKCEKYKIIFNRVGEFKKYYLGKIAQN